MGIRIEKIRNISFRSIVRGLGAMWKKAYHPVLIVVWIVLIGIGGYLWYQTFYVQSLSENQRSAVISSRFSSNDLQKGTMEKVIGEIEESRKRFERDIAPIKNIFRQY